MGKRSTFERRERDFYPTPYEAVEPLIPHLPKGVVFDEPCAGDGVLIQHLESFDMNCAFASDVCPDQSWDLPVIKTYDVFDRTVCHGDYFITNPPWDRKILHPLICHLSMIAPTWLLFDADWMHTKQSADLIKRCVKIVSVGRVKWIADSKMTGKDNCCWYLFDAKHDGPTEFIGR